MSKCTFKQETPNGYVNDTRDKKLVQAIESHIGMQMKTKEL